MLAMVLREVGARLVPEERPDPEPAPGEVRIRVEACAVCRTDLHVIDGELPQTVYPIVPGHEVVGIVEAVGAGVTSRAPGTRVGVPWLGHACGRCPYCQTDRENLCDAPGFTGCTRDGGFATHLLAEAAFTIPLDAGLDPVATAPLLCAGLIGWRTLRMAGAAGTVGLYGFGAAAHIVAQVCRWQGRRVFALTRPGDREAQDFARALGAAWAGGSDEAPPEPLDVALIFAPDGRLVPAALKAVRKGGRVVCGGIHMSDIPAFPYDLLWGERAVLSVANLTREDARSFFEIVPRAGIVTHTRAYPLARANEAVAAHRSGALRGAAVLVP
ncbi:alcohol dehydrogenase, propanol-preferring [Methylobacterium sp. UNC378MF]|uniref:zinc-dependent alcohol dehydrogenase family protein n=1 Tax=Methylobacterium sp. UNC378MF TaxID=1502748 RepID=UPI0008872100|nr:zinc-dependent alcohol dehydrogenase family protein [Methylobacterium sp. UNC378MF]SDA33123.1 alcohol dehydrogenase, propanol-preferring [Methylobacterium sp. UNC378MF]